MLEIFYWLNSFFHSHGIESLSEITKELRNAMIISAIGYIGVSILLTRYLGNHGIWFSLLLFMIFRAATLQFYFKNILKKF